MPTRRASHSHQLASAELAPTGSGYDTHLPVAMAALARSKGAFFDHWRFGGAAGANGQLQALATVMATATAGCYTQHFYRMIREASV